MTACEVTDANNARSPGFQGKPGCVSAALAIRQENLSCEANPIGGECCQPASKEQYKTCLTCNVVECRPVVTIVSLTFLLLGNTEPVRVIRKGCLLSYLR